MASHDYYKIRSQDLLPQNFKTTHLYLVNYKDFILLLDRFQHQIFTIKIFTMLLVLLLLVSYGCLAESQPPNPSSILIRTPPTLLDSFSSSDSICPTQSSSDILDKEIRKTRNIINSHYQLRPCKCGGPGWTRVLDLNMADNGTSCPVNWRLREEPVRGCGRKTFKAKTCDSVLIPVTMNYSMICGRIYAYQKGWSGAFTYSVQSSQGVNESIDSPYVAGLSLTHGEVGQRKHVWTFAGAWDEKSIYKHTSCPCIKPAHTWPFKVPSYVGDNYFCDTGAPTLTHDHNKVFMDDPLWDGEGCGGSSTCCSFNSPPWFCQHSKYHTSDNLELRLCSLWDSRYEDKLISLVEIYVK